MKNIHIIPTDKPSRLHLGNSGLVLCDLNYNSSIINAQNIYITSDEEIKVGDWVIEFQKGDNIGEVHFINGEYVIANDIQKKIIITTDQDLERVQSIDDEFLEWFVKNPSCREAGVDKNWNYPLDKSWEYKIIIPKEEHKQDPLEEAAERLFSKEKYPTEFKTFRKAFISNAKWQQKRMYNEEEMLQALNIGFTSTDETWEECVEFTKEQFKKK